MPRATLIAVFDDRLQAEQALRDLEAAGFKDDQLGFAIRGSEAARGGMITDAVGTKDGRGAVVGAATGAVVGGLLGAAAAVLLPGIGPVIVAGIFTSAFGGAVAGTAVGGILGAMKGLDISQEEAEFYEHSFRAGKAIVAVRAGDRCRDAEEIFRRHHGYNLHLSRESPVPTEGFFNRP